MKLWHKIAIGVGVIAGLSLAQWATAAPLLPFQGGTGTGLTPASGTLLIGNGTGTYSNGFLLCSGGCSITNASGSITINQGGSPATTTITASGTTQNGPSFTFGSTTIIQPYFNGGILYMAFINPGYITTSTLSALSPLVYTSSSGQFSCPTCIATNTGNWAGTWQGVNTNNFLSSSTSYVSSFNTQMGAAVYSDRCISGCTVTTSTTSTAITVTAGSPAGSSTYVQYNTGGSFDATSTFTFTSSTGVLSVPSISVNGSPLLVYNKYLSPNTATTTAGGTATSTLATLSIPAATTTTVYLVQYYVTANGTQNVTTTFQIGGVNILNGCNMVSTGNGGLFTLTMQNSTSSEIASGNGFGNCTGAFGIGAQSINLSATTTWKIFGSTPGSNSINGELSVIAY